jgi:thiazole synthase ThiGH ThiG subunit
LVDAESDRWREGWSRSELWLGRSTTPACTGGAVANASGGRSSRPAARQRVLTRGKWRTVEILAYPVMWRPHPEQTASARSGYEDWWQALDWVRDGLVAGRMLREMEVPAVMPKVRPWGSG